VGSEVSGPVGGEGMVLLVEGGWMAEKNWVMVGWEGLMVVRWRLRGGGCWQCMRAAGLGVERDVIGDGEAVGGGMGSRGSWLFHTSQCKALQVCSGRARELGTGTSVGSSS